MFGDSEIALAESFRDQALIAIENARLFNEVQEALERQTATAEILNVIASSPTDTQPVFDVIARSATELCEGMNSGVYLLQNGLVHVAGHHNVSPEQLALAQTAFPTLPHRGIMSGRAILDRAVAHVPDIATDPEYTAESIVKAGFRSVVAVPMLRNGEPIGAINVTREEARPFSDRQIEVLRTFADQAVIAIENARLFEEVQAKTSDLSEALQQQIATADVLQVISNSVADTAPVFDKILEGCGRLFNGVDMMVFLVDDEMINIAAVRGPDPQRIERMLRLFPRPLTGTATEIAIRERRLMSFGDVSNDPGVPEGLRRLAEQFGESYAVAIAPMLWEDRAIGAILVSRDTPLTPFDATEQRLLRTFADQAVIAIENARLFNETQEALERQTATADILKVIASSPSDVQPVFQTIAERSNRLLSGLSTAVFSIVDDVVHLSGFTATSPEADTALKTRFPAPLSSFGWSELIRKGEIVRMPETEAEPERFRNLARIRGFRSALFVPLLRDRAAIGLISVTRAEPGPFADYHVHLLLSFADQAVIAISNVGLFQDVQKRTRELSASLDELRTAQDRLVQTEKLASLGQLTAGIAHEIKNPLNFVNNFSALSAELVGEMSDVLAGTTLDTKTRGELDELAQMLKSNLEKVVQHGKRADSIVKNMLQHSREGSGEHRPTDINAIVEESLNLAYHGARAEKAGFHIAFQRDLEPSIGMADVYPQEITRVLLNLISNGFYATAKRKAEVGDSFEPILSAATKNLGEKVEIRIRDNGTGIPEEAKAKIFSPFFTTKPSGEGTGLGLSMSHDIIVKQHGGSIDFETEPGLFTEFKIVLPRTNQT
jgi:two-component system, NtrC family, sensor kinase